MNEFTKEELEDLLIWGEVYTDFGNSWTDKIQRPLLDKIQSMIDNYCEHDTEGHFHVGVDVCLKCGVIINDN